MRFISYEEPSNPNRSWDVYVVFDNVGNTPGLFSSLAWCAQAESERRDVA
jgi:hypothetical protein